MTRMAGLLYGGLCYVIFLLTFLYAVGFVAGFGVPRTLDRGPATAPWAAAAVDLGLLAVFALQHSGMARRAFKRWLATWLPPSAERSTYVLVSSAALILLFWQWRPIEGIVWQVESGWGIATLYALYALGWLWLLTGTFVINHFDLFGLRQVWRHARREPCPPLAFEERLHYRLMRHPLMLGFIVAFWATPRMTLGHLLFAAASTGYILLALQLEERDLVAAHGKEYERYRARVPSLLPWPRPHDAAAPTASLPR